MSDEGEYWRDVRPAMIEASKQKRASNREQSAKLLNEAKITFVSRNDGAHLIILAKAGTFDFWPGTGLWQMRGSTQQHRGVRRLVARIKEGAKA